jgi:Holliday junction DNA helicase RuvA
VALNVLSGVSLQDLVQSVNRGDPMRLQKIPGVGEKTAQRLVMELRGRLGVSSSASALKSSSSASGSGGVSSAQLPIRDEVYEAMLSLGYNEKQVSRALERVEPGMKEDEPVEAWIRKVLQVI